METLSERVKLIHSLSGLTQFRFGKEAKVAPYYISKIESNTMNPTDAVLNKICAAFKVYPDWLFKGEGEIFEDEAKNAAAKKLIADIKKGKEKLDNLNLKNKGEKKGNTKKGTKDKTGAKASNKSEANEPVNEDKHQNTEIIINEPALSLTAMIYKNIVMEKISRLIDTSRIPKDKEDEYWRWLTGVVETVEKISFIEKSAFMLPDGAQKEKAIMLEQCIKELAEKLI